MSTAHWIPLNPDALNSGEALPAPHGIHISFKMSPYDVPEAVRGFLDESRDQFVIEFKYMLQEEPTRSEEKDGVVFRIGKHSGRVYELCVPIEWVRERLQEMGDVRPFEDISTGVYSRLSGFLQRYPSAAPANKRNVAERAIETTRSELFSDLQPM
jgi:hypothetical protein